jgi:hypothetical protein
MKTSWPSAKTDGRRNTERRHCDSNRDFPWYGYKKIAVMCHHAHQAMTDCDAYTVMRDHGLLHKPRSHVVEAYQTARLFELLPQYPNEL